MQKKAFILIAMFIFGIAVVFTMTGSPDIRQSSAVVVGSAAPDFQLQDLSGKIWKLSDLKGKVVLLHFWATWCTTCEEENPTLQRLYEAEQEDGKIVLLSVLIRDDAERAKAYMRDKKFTFPVLADTKAVGTQYGLRGVPETFLIDKKGIVRDKVIGPNLWDTPEVRAALARFAIN
ncbi:MAG TPA: TlpA disulfide reductase family protein [Dissulfurispiraceae bacterium]|nr:TlpA disulfide reductase family protein [Dissulfurispiraceae bacterium]